VRRDFFFSTTIIALEKEIEGIEKADRMNNSLTQCPVCQGELTITRLKCESCDTSLEGRFGGGPFSHLSREQTDFLLTFIRCEGKLNRVEVEMGLSYPTLRNKLLEVIRSLGFEPGREEPVEVTDDQRRQVLDDLDSGKITADAAMRMLRGDLSGQSEVE